MANKGLLLPCIWAACFALTGLTPDSVVAAPGDEYRASVQFPAQRGGGESTHLTVVAPRELKDLADTLTTTLEISHEDFSVLFGPLPPMKTAVRLLDEETFFAETGAPRWTNALFYRGQIIIPVSPEGYDPEGMARSVRHEFTHAVLHGVSLGRVPGWLDEGLAQWAEGEENPALRPALLDWLQRRRPVPLAMLQGGFTRLPSSMVAPAYAQSLFAASSMIRTYGFDRIRRYLDRLGKGDTSDQAFIAAFGMSEAHFERQLGETLTTWSTQRLHHGHRH